MARKQSGGFNKFLNLIGLVDDVDPRDSYGDEYNSQNYGRQNTYVPQQQRNAAAGRNSANNARGTQQPARRIPAQAGRSNYGTTQRTYGGEDDFRSSRRGPVMNDNYENFDDAYAEETVQRNAPQTPRMPNRPRSRFEEEDQQQTQQRPTSARPAVKVSARPRTVVSSLHSLEDCCDVIDCLIEGNMIVLTMNELDGRLLQRAVDTLSGAVFALHATIRKPSEMTYLIAPAGMEVDDAYDMDRRF